MYSEHKNSIGGRRRKQEAPQEQSGMNFYKTSSNVMLKRTVFRGMCDFFKDKFKPYNEIYLKNKDGSGTHNLVMNFCQIKLCDIWE
jgi:hypothetical protein